ncbi:MAG TPA: type IV pilus assembly protein PilM [Candidatus Woesebacteria bacterium]|nr:type IV pilus assembly protein PilM [Candidatus Woesebacteria bacterium]
MSNLIGVDIGVGSIKIVSVSKMATGYSLEAIGETKNPKSDWVKEGSKGKGMQEVANAIKSLLSDLKIKPKQVVVSLPEDEVVSRLIRLPPLKDGEIMDALRFEAETFVPFPLNEVSIDYEEIEKDDAGRLTVFAIAARNDLIASYVKLFKMVGLELAAIESPAISMRRTVNLTVSDKAALLLIDMGEKYSDIISINSGNIYFTRAMSVGGESLTRAISINLGLDMASAEEYKKAYGMKEMELEGKIKSAILPVFANMAEEIRRALASFREEQGKPVELLVLSGGGANMPGLAEELTKILGVEVQVIQPFIKMDTSKITVPIDFNSDGCRYCLAVGLALREIP